MAPSAATYAADRQHTRSSKGLSPHDLSRPRTPQDAVDDGSRRDSIDGQLKWTNKKYAANTEHAREDLQNLKIPLKSGLPPKKGQSGQQQFTNSKMPPSNQHQPTGLDDMQKSKVGNRRGSFYALD